MYHINSDGNVRQCRATSKPCPFGGNDGNQNHYSTKEEALKAFEKEMSSNEKSPKASELVKKYPLFQTEPNFMDSLNINLRKMRDHSRRAMERYESMTVPLTQAQKNKMHIYGEQNYIWFVVETKAKREDLTISEALSKVSHDLILTQYDESVGLEEKGNQWINSPERTKRELSSYALTSILRKCGVQ